MILSRTPFRVSFFGGGTDYPHWYRQHGGAVVGSTINKYCHISCRYLPPFFDHRIRVVYSKIENCQTLDEIQHPAVRECLRYLRISKGVEIHHDGDLPARGGIGSSSAFTVGLLNALHALKGHIINKRDLASEGIYIEQDRLRETVGSQDQVLTCYGGINHVVFQPNGEIDVRPVTLNREAVRELNRHFLLFFTGVQRTASDIAASYVGDLSSKKESQMRSISGMVESCLDILKRGNYYQFGKLLHESWLLKQSLGEQISNSRVAELYTAALSAGALGGKLIGAGGGGYLLVFAHPGEHPKILRQLSQCVHVPFRFEFSGSQIVFYDPEEEYVEQEAATDPEDLMVSAISEKSS
ncbi:MAG: kinase [Candidatus Eremiobacteraeota bacterium]|nr:kinase [Candidatus Eremiobacteraeota bacterium]MCW5868798.1 kinase [Candidatus Eremiobacteraeota bacterium]